MMKKFLKGLLVFTISLFMYAILVDFIISSGLKKSEYMDFKEWNDIYYGRVHSDVIINGSSRAWVQISPQIIDSILGLKSYNFGMDAYNFHAQYYRYQVYQKHNPLPKIIIQTLDIFTLEKRADLFGYTQFLPYLYDPLMIEMTRAYKGLEVLDYVIPLFKYRFQHELIQIGVSEFFNIKHYQNDKYKGYEPREKEWDQQAFEIFKELFPDGMAQPLHPESIQLFDDYLAKCKRNNIQVFLVYSPEYIEIHDYLPNRENVIRLYKKLAKKHGFPFLDYSYCPLAYDKTLFYGTQHLNKGGAEIFTKILANDIKKLLNGGNLFSSAEK